MSYKDTLNLPKTDFPIKANLQKVEPELLKFWQEQNIYEKLKTQNSRPARGGAKLKKFILHDGPPYPNGDIHLGHALNKVLKDIVVKFKSMNGYYSPILFGWDCHGLPIETQLLKDLGIKRHEMDIVEFRLKCREYALKYVDLQRTEFKRLGILGEWDDPYLTLDYAYEEKVVELFGKLAEEGYVYKGLKPIHWCPNCETALAEAEIEYEDEKSHSIYVKFFCPSANLYFVIWTTTPWTLPANVAIAVHPDFIYCKIKVKDDVYIIAEGLLTDFATKLKISDYKILEKVKGHQWEGLVCRHPFMNRDSVVVADNLVTLEQGTGAVHIAPGHGEEDYQVGLKYKLPMIMPVDGKGYFTDEAGRYKTLRYDKANKIILEDMQKDGSLLYEDTLLHSYPHCWRCKKPVIFRATQQWFIAVDHKDLRARAIQAIKATKWYPSWGENRITGMVESRPDWCVSRQRSWGVPIPAFYCKACGKPNVTGKFNAAAKKLVRAEGSDGWFKKSPEEILPFDLKCQYCGGGVFEKETDILDVWFESGASHYAVLEGNLDYAWPADLYLEGSDQHRGWFQSSLLAAVAWQGRAPFQNVLTHGFTVDESGKKMSKSLGNVIDPQVVVKEYGADILRLWVASADFRSDMSASKNILNQVRDAYHKIRNTCRFLLSNINDFDFESSSSSYSQLFEVDKWVLLKLNQLISRVKYAYENFEFHTVLHSVHAFCINELSALYLDVIKDRLYCDRNNSISRRAAQTVCYQILISLVRLIAPVLSFAAEEIQQNLKPRTSVFLEEFPDVVPAYENKLLEEKWNKLLGIREDVYRILESARNAKTIGSSLEAELELYADGELKKFLNENPSILQPLFIVSGVILVDHLPEGAVSGQNHPNLGILVHKSNHKKCERCWIHFESVGQNKRHPALCTRCVEVIEKSNFV